jgi:hypothetical protein
MDIDEPPTDIPESKYDIRLWQLLRIKLSMEQLQDLRDWLDKQNIEYERGKNGES